MGMSLDAIEPIRFAREQPLPQALALRYRVYCEEFGYLPADDYPEGTESDENDLVAAHFHLFEAQTRAKPASEPDEWRRDAPDTLAAYVRLVKPGADGQLPVQRRCQLSLPATALPEPSACAEVSRLIIAPEFRRTRRATVKAGHRAAEQVASTELLLNLFKQMYDYSRSHGIRYWFAAMERPLARSLGQMGFPFKAVGPEGEFFGRITPYMADLQDLQLRVATSQPRLAQWLLAPRNIAADTGFDDRAATSAPIWAHRPPPPQLWRAEC